MYQTQFPRSLSPTLPTMYDLPSEDPEESGLPDQFHDFQPVLLRETCKSNREADLFFGIDLNIYYDLNHTLWHKRPDYFLVVGIPTPARQEDLRWSYVMWQEGISPTLVVELLSPGTEDEDLGRKPVRDVGKPPTKWEVYERILQVPFYVVYDRYENLLRVFTLEQGRYQEVTIDPENPKFWLDSLGLGLGIWQGPYLGVEGKWLRWYDAQGDWIMTPMEQNVVERSAKELAESQLQSTESQLQAEQIARRSAISRLLALGLTAQQVAEALGYSIVEVQQEEVQQELE